MDPAHRRLAIRVEDHPFEYADFEGVLPAGEYGAGYVIVWDRGPFQVIYPANGDAAVAIENGRIEFELRGKKLYGGFALVRIRGKRVRRPVDPRSWLLIKKRDSYATYQDVEDLDPHSVKSGLTVTQLRS